MGINVSRAISQANNIRDYSGDLRDTGNRLKCFKADLNNQWQAEEMIYLNRAIDELANELSGLSSVLDSISSDIITTAHEIRREEEARARARARARAAAAAAAAAKK